MQHRTDLTAPAWATDHDIDDGGIHWSHEVAAETRASVASEGKLAFGAHLTDSLEVDEFGGISLVRGDIEFYLADQAMTLEQARGLAAAITAVVDHVEAGA